MLSAAGIVLPTTCVLGALASVLPQPLLLYVSLPHMSQSVPSLSHEGTAPAEGLWSVSAGLALSPSSFLFGTVGSDLLIIFQRAPSLPFCTAVPLFTLSTAVSSQTPLVPALAAVARDRGRTLVLPHPPSALGA